MHWLLKFVIIVAGNGLALWLAWLYVPGFELNTANWVQLAAIALILALLNAILKPILTLILGPVIVLTLGVGILVVNAIILYVLSILPNYIDFLQGSIRIDGIPALIYATLIVTAVNFVIHLIA
jgi:putative membrane protein